MKAQLILENGMTFEGRAFGYFKESIGEVVFNTSMTGYQEILTDPTSYGQMLVLTYPLIGNYGINLDDMESKKVYAKALIVREKSKFPNNFRCELTLDGYMKANRIIGIEGIDTRALTKVITEYGTMRGIISVRELTPSQIKLKLESFSNSKAVEEITRETTMHISGSGKHMGIIDLGVKQSVIHSLKIKDCQVTVFPAFTSSREILESNLDGLLLSSGPGSPKDIPAVINTTKEMIGKIPLIGIGLGHQVLVLALGGDINKLKFGHHGVNHSVRDMIHNKIITTSQCHNYVVCQLPKEAVLSHENINDRTIEGMYIEEKNIYSIQFHPHAPTIMDEVDPVFEDFLTVIEGGIL